MMLDAAGLSQKSALTAKMVALEGARNCQEMISTYLQMNNE